MKSLSYTEKDGGLEDDAGVFWQNRQDLLIGRLGFCGCGMPEEVLRVLREALRLIDEPRPESANWKEWYEKDYRPRVEALFHNDLGLEFLTYYTLDRAEWTEHGGSVPGWLTGEGDTALAWLNEMDL